MTRVGAKVAIVGKEKSKKYLAIIQQPGSVKMMLEHIEELMAAETEFQAVLLDVRAQLEEFRREL